MSAYERPRQRKGFNLTAVWWNREGRITRTVYEPIIKEVRAVAAKPVAITPPQQVRRGALAAETRVDLFSRD